MTKYYIHNYINVTEEKKLELYHKSFYFLGKRKRVLKRGHSRTSYFEGFNFNNSDEKLKAYLRSVDWSLNILEMDARNKLGEKTEEGKDKIVLKSTDLITIYINNKEAVKLLNRWNEKKYMHEDVLINREFYKVVQTIGKIRKWKRVGIKFEYISDKDNEAIRLIKQYEYRYRNKDKDFGKLVFVGTASPVELTEEEISFFDLFDI